MLRKSNIVLALVMMAFCASNVRAAEAEAMPNVIKAAKELAAATVAGEWVKAVDATYETVIKEMGGREAAVKLIEESFKTMQKEGMSIKSLDLGDAGELMEEDGKTFVVFPTKLEMKMPGAKVLATSYLLGISTDGGKTWKFVDGAGLADAAMKAKVLPKLPAKLTLPENKPPQVIKE